MIYNISFKPADYAKVRTLLENYDYIHNTLESPDNKFHAKYNLSEEDAVLLALSSDLIHITRINKPGVVDKFNV